MSKTDAATRPLAWHEGLRLIVESAPIPRSMEVSLLEALGLVCADDVSSTRPVPPFDNSSMDGYAVRAEDMAGACADSPIVLQVVGEVLAGSIQQLEVGPGQAAAIMTGAPTPPGANAVVKVESTCVGPGGVVEVFEAVASGSCVRRAGADTAVGEGIISRGDLITPGLIGLLASCGRATIPVFAKPTIALCTSGDEVVDPADSTQLRHGQIYDSNSVMLRALLASWGYRVEFLGTMPDDPEAMQATLRRGLDYDYLVTVGGVSMGRRDYLRPCLEAMGAKEVFWRLNQQPGGPMLYALAGNTRVLGLPGNPVSCYFCADLYLKQALRAASGGEPGAPQQVTARLEEPLSKPHGKAAFIRARLRMDGGELLARSTGPQDSNRIRSITGHDGYILFREEARQLSAGEKVAVLVTEATRWCTSN